MPFGLKKRIVLRVPVFRKETPQTAAGDAEEILLPEDLGRVSEPTRGALGSARAEAELRQVRSLMAQVALDLIARVIEINRYFAAAGFVKSPEVSPPGQSCQEPEASSGKPCPAGSAGDLPCAGARKLGVGVGDRFGGVEAERRHDPADAVGSPSTSTKEPIGVSSRATTLPSQSHSSLRLS